MNQAAGEAGSDQLLLDPNEVRVLGVLAEKEALTPDSYPLSLNALTNGCNQLSSREPVMSLSEETVMEVLQRLIRRKLVAEVRQANARVAKYEHRMRIVWLLEQDKLAILSLLMLRGAQTAGEIRARSGRLHDFASVAEVETGLQFLIDKFPPLVARLARTPGTKESRYVHLLSGSSQADAEGEAINASSAGTARRSDRLAELEQEVAELRQVVQGLSEQLENFKKQFE